MKTKISRDAALKARPVKVPPRRTEIKDGKLYVTVAYQRPRWQRWLGADERCERSYGLDAYGRDVYEACDGRTPVKQVIKRFGKRHKVSPVEAEKAVTMFLKTLMSRGLIGMEMPNSERGTRNAE